MALDWNNIFLKDLDWIYAIEIIVRTLLMFSVILIFLRLTGKKGVRQLSIFEVAIIIALGSAAGDPMINNENAIIPSLVVFSTILLFYRLVTWAAAKKEKFESILEGDPVYVVENGMFVILDSDEHTFGKDEFFSEMRQQSVEHVGQIQTAILETNGNLSLFYFEDDQVRAGLPILPKAYEKRSKQINFPGSYACTACGNVEMIKTNTHQCGRCNKIEWVASVSTLRKA